jgi:Flp pilus assembly protein TadD
MANPFLSSEEYDDRAHKLYDEGDYDSALETLKEGLRLYPHSVDLYVGIGYTRLAREEYGWARQAFERARVLDPEHEDALVGMGEVLLRLGQQAEALVLFGRARETGCADDLELLMTMGRALYREQLYGEARDIFAEAATLYPDSADAAAALGFALHRQGEETTARRHLRRALHLDASQHEARVYLGHLLYDRGDWAGALRELEQVPPSEHWDSLALCRVIELKRALQADPALAEVAEWEARLEELESSDDPIDRLLAEIEAGIDDTPVVQGEREEQVAVAADAGLHRLQLPEGEVCAGTWHDIVRQLRDARGGANETIAQFMRRRAEEAHARIGLVIPVEDAKQFLLGGARAGFWHIEY